MSTNTKRLGKYELQKRLGGGGMGEVWKAFDTQLHRHVAIKLLHPDLQNDSNFTARFQREAQAVASLHHPNIVQLYDFQVSQPSTAGNVICYMVMNRIEGQTLAHYIHSLSRAGKHTPISDIVPLFASMSLAIDYAHQKGMIHGSIKPSSILLDKSNTAHNAMGEPVLTDFGIAKLPGASTVALIGSWLGTSHYTSPEQSQGMPANERSDIYSLGVILYEICTGLLPFQGENTAAILMQHINATPTLPNHINPNIPSALTTVIMRSMTKDPAERFFTASALTVALAKALHAPIPEWLGSTSTSISAYNKSKHQELIQPSTLSPIPSAESSSPPLLTHSSVPLAPSLEGRASSMGTENLSDSSPMIHPPEQPLAVSLPVSPILAVANHVMAQSSQSSANSQTLSTQTVASPRQPVHKRNKWKSILLITAVLLLLLLTAIPLALHSFQNAHSIPTASLPKSGLGVTKIADGEYIGISNGTFAFDTKRTDGDLKTQAAARLRANDPGSADSLWQQAVKVDTNDAEALIYMEDRRVIDSGDPYITVVVGTTLTGNPSVVASGRESVQAAYVAQKEYNTGSKLPTNMKVRLLLANSGSVATNATVVAQQVVQLAQADKTVVAVMGWTTTATTLNAIGVLSSAKIPMVTNSGADALTGRSRYFFRIAAPGSSQGLIGAQYAEQTLRAKKAVVFVDIKNDFTSGLANGFTSRFTQDGNSVVATESYTVGNSTTLPNLLQGALSKHPDMIYFAGYPADAGVLLAQLQPSDPPILGGSSFYQLGGFSTAAQKGLSHLRFTAFSYPDEWQILGLGAKTPPFFADYQSAFDPNKQHPAYGYSRADGTTMELYDAMSVLLYGCSIALAEKNPIIGADLQHALTEVTGDKAFQGITSQISLGSDSNPIDRAVVMVCVTKDHFLKMDGIHGKFLIGEAVRTQFNTTSVCN